ncbi:MAG: cytochrome c oxidase assembly protein [Chloroflexi bacterium]|jgi:cytochrome c oxidase assembly factor CtaG|nr:cytochrome c oxidase assembly protein [Chloroflexota bacterium]
MPRFRPRPARRQGARLRHVGLAAVAALLAFPAVARVAVAHGAGDGPPPTDPLSIATAWVLDPLPIIGIAVSTVLYLAAVRTVDRRHPANPWQRSRTAFFLVGMASVAAALLSPLDGLADDLASVHMLQHSVLAFLAAPCLVASGVVTLALRVATPAARDRWLLPLLHSRVVSALTFPLVGWIAMVLAMWGTHFSGVYDLALRDEGVHALEHAVFLGAALLFWTPVFSPDPLRWRLSHPAKILYLLSQMPTMSWLAVSILNAGVVLWPTYLARTPFFGISALADQQLSGAIMWGLGDGAFMVAMGLVIWDWMKSEEVESTRVDARLARERSARAAIDARADALAARRAAESAATAVPGGER